MTRPNIQMEPTRRKSCAIMPLRRAAHLARQCDKVKTALWRRDLGTELPHLADGSPRP